jgi:exodeoxyribonuclease-5
VFVDVPNALINRNIRERNQLLYVAITRAAKRVFLAQ